MLRSLVLRTWYRDVAYVCLCMGSENAVQMVKKPGKEWAGACFRLIVYIIGPAETYPYQQDGDADEESDQDNVQPSPTMNSPQGRLPGCMLHRGPVQRPAAELCKGGGDRLPQD